MSASVPQETGSAVVGTFAAGSRSEDHVRAGHGAASLVGVGADATVSSEVGLGKAGTVGTGAARQGLLVKSGLGVAGTIGVGSDAMVDTEGGFATASTVASGTANHVYTESGFGKVGTVGAGSTSSFRVYGKSGAGTQLRVINRGGVGVITCVGAGARNMEFAETGYATVNGDGFGFVDIAVFLTRGASVDRAVDTARDTGAVTG
jgi:hypothetical protein